MTKNTLRVMEMTSAMANAANTPPRPAAVPLLLSSLLSSQVSMLGVEVEVGFRTGGRLEDELSANSHTTDLIQSE